MKSKKLFQFLQIGILSFFILTACSKKDSDIETAELLRDTALQSNRAWEIVESLTTEIGPRLAGTSADARAVAWAKQMLENSGFDKVWLEPVNFPIWERQKEVAHVLTPYPQELKITALGYSGSTGGELIADVIEFDNLAELKEANNADIEGKFVFINQAMERHREGRGYGQTVGIRRDGPVVAKEKGAAAVLIRSVGSDHNRLPHTGSTTRMDDPLPAAALSVPDAEQLARILSRHGQVTLSLDIGTSLRQSGQSFNVIAELTGSEKPEEILLLGAHLDSWDLGTGAIDDGAGVAIISAAAQLIAELPTRPKRSLRVVLYANEEAGIWGGNAYRDAHQQELNKHILASESDLGAGEVWEFNTNSLKFAEIVKPVLSTMDIAVTGEATSGGPDIGPLMNAGVPVIRLRQDGSDYFDYHHTANDTLDKINPEALKQNVAAWAAVYFLAANSEIDFREVGTEQNE
ncbi:M28 family metallopeptidase [Aurantivibrio infirmus]